MVDEIMVDEMLDFLNLQKDNIIQNWMTGLEKEYPSVYDLIELRKHGLVYFNLMIFDISIPVKQHPSFEQLTHWCKVLFKKNIPIDHVLHSSHMFRESVTEAILLTHLDSVAHYRTVTIISSRIDEYERAVCNYYWENSRSLIEEKDKQLDELHEDKLNLIGKMAASMAHEIRNPLTSIKGFIKLTRSKLPQDSLNKVERYLEIIEGEFDNIQMQITGFLSFSKKPVIEEQFVSILIEHLIESVLVLVNPRLINENIELSVTLQKDLLINVQKVSIQQVLSNLLNNGIDALCGINGTKKIIIQSHEDQKHIYIEIINNGPEIPKEIQNTVFHPFVTSKLDGTGLGLAICKQIMEKNKGNISFTSTSNETTFILVFEKS